MKTKAAGDSLCRFVYASADAVINLKISLAVRLEFFEKICYNICEK